MTGSEFDEGILLDKSRLKFVVAGEVALVKDFDSIFLFGDSMRGLHDLWRTVSHAVWQKKTPRYVLWNRTPPLECHQN